MRWLFPFVETEWANVKGFPKRAGTLSPFASEGGSFFPATDQRFLIYVDAVTSWTRTGLGSTSIKSMAVGSRYLFAATDVGLTRSQDHGRTWAVRLKNPRHIKSETKLISNVRQVPSENSNLMACILRRIQSGAISNEKFFEGTNDNYKFVSKDNRRTRSENRSYWFPCNLASVTPETLFNL